MDITQAYVQSYLNLKLSIYNYPNIFFLVAAALHQLINPMKALKKSGNYSNKTLQTHHMNNTGINITAEDQMA